MKKKFEPTKIFVVEDDPMYQKMVKYIMELNPDHEVYAFATGEECVQHLHLQPSVISLDYSLPDMTGEDVLTKIKNYNKDIAVVILSSQQDVSTAVALLRQGAYDYITKDNETKEKLLNTLDHIRQQQALKKEVQLLKQELQSSYAFEKNIIGTSAPMQAVFALMKKASQTNITVSISGQTGTGKEVVAKSIHYNSTRHKEAFVAVNMSAIPRDLLESELFGYEKGAFTGATTRKKGMFELADKGTLFLDEIGEMDINLQAKVLRAIQERDIVRLGGEKPIKFDARIIIATHRNLVEEVREGPFRDDLYYRLLGLPIPLPPLAARGNDILLRAQHFLQQFALQNQLGELHLSKSAKEKLLAYGYPGNVRELKAAIELAAVLSNEGTITPEDIRFNNIQKSDSLFQGDKTLEAYKRLIIHHYLEKYQNDIGLVAQKLDIGKSTIYRMLKEENEEKAAALH